MFKSMMIYKNKNCKSNTKIAISFLPTPTRTFDIMDSIQQKIQSFSESTYM